DPVSGGTFSKTATDAGGRFEISNVVPGGYVLISSANDEFGHTRTRRVSVDVGPGGESIRIGVTEGARGPGRAVIEGSLDSKAVQDLDRIRFTIQLDPRIPGTEPDTYAPLPDGSFALSGLPPGDHRIALLLPPGKLYLKSIRLGKTDVTDG